MAMFKLYHVVDRKVPAVAMGNGAEAIWPDDYYHVADVEAVSDDDVFRITNNDFTRSKLGNWQHHHAVTCYVNNPRSTAPGDVVVFDGKVIRFLMGRNETLS